MRKAIRSVVQAVTRLYPFYTGTGAVAHARLPRRLTTGDELALTKLSDGSRILVYVDDYLGRTVLYTGDFDPRVTWVLRRLLRPGDTFIDIGANVGVLSLVGARLVGKTGIVYAFEPQPRLANLMRVSAELNGYDNLHVHEVALSDKEGSFPLHTNRKTTLFASLEGAVDDVDSAITVPVKTTLSFMESLNLGAIRLLKIDVERHEEAVFRGAGDYFRRHRPGAIVFESTDDGHPFFERGAVREIAALGYEFFQIPKPFVRMRLLPVTKDHTSRAQFHDFVAVAAGEAGAEVRGRLGIGAG